MEGVDVRTLPLKNGFVEFSEQIKIPFRPMIGVIGVAPAGTPVNCGTPGAHGGNMDCKEIVEGATLYLPVQVEGALLALGDLHAVMGDGEVSCCGAETPGEVTVQLEVLKDVILPTPFIQNDHTYITIASEKTADEAIVSATENAVQFLMEYAHFERAEALSFLSLACDVRICQAVDPLITVRMEIPKKFFSQKIAF